MLRLLAVLAFLCITSVRADAQFSFVLPRSSSGTVEVVVPTRQKSLVQVAGAPDQAGVVSVNGFKGAVTLNSDGTHQILTVIPSDDAVPTDLRVTIAGQHQTI